MIKLIDILKENKYESILDSILGGNYSELYYFGGYEDPRYRSTKLPTDTVVAVDKIDLSQNKVWDNYIQADLNTNVNLPPKKAIFMVDGVISPSNEKILSQNIYNSLKPGGYLVLIDYISIAKKLVKELLKDDKFKIAKEYKKTYNNPTDYEEEGKYEPLILQKN